jgi:hypothetical protein
MTRRARGARTAGYVFVLAALTIAGMTIAPPPANGRVLAFQSIGSLILIIAAGAWLTRRDRPPSPAPR